MKKLIVLRHDLDSLSTTNQAENSRVKPVEQEQTSAPTLNSKWSLKGKNLSFFSEVQMTIRARVHFGRRKASLLLAVLAAMALGEGIDLLGYMSLIYLYNWIKEDKSNLGAQEYKLSMTLRFTEFLIRELAQEWLTFDDLIVVEIDSQIFQDLSSFLPTSDQYNSWKVHYQPREFLEVRIVPLDTYSERETNTQRYSAYCKGYGNGGKPYPAGKTRYSSELDGEDEEAKPLVFTQNQLDQINALSERLTKLEEYIGPLR